MADFIPATDGDFDSYTENFNTYVDANLADFGLVRGDVAALNAAQTGWDTGYPLVAPAVAAVSAATQAKARPHPCTTAMPPGRPRSTPASRRRMSNWIGWVVAPTWDAGSC